MPVCDLIATKARILYAPLGATLPADTVAAGGVFPAGWVEVGYTSEPTKLAYKSEELDFKVEQSLGTVRSQRVDEEASIETVLAEITAQNLALAWDGDMTSVAPGVGQPGKEELTLGGNTQLTERMWCIEGSYIDEDLALFPVRVFVWKATATTGGELQFSRKDAMGIGLKLKVLEDLSKPIKQQLMKIQKILEPGS